MRGHFTLTFPLLRINLDVKKNVHAEIRTRDNELLNLFFVKISKFDPILVDTHNVVIIYSKPFIGINCNAKKTRISINHKSSVALRKVVDYRRFRKIGQICQILQKFIFRRILIFQLVFLKK